MQPQKGLTTTGTILDRIMAHKQTEIAVAQTKVPLRILKSNLAESRPATDFKDALLRDTVALIAEVKKASPSKGVFLENFDPLAIAQEYEQHGAAAISVLTDEHFFQGSLESLASIHENVALPLLRKEFVLDPYQLYEARLAGASAVLLIAACLEDALLRDLYDTIYGLGMHALVEVHTEQELERVLAFSPQIIGINNRNLHTFEVDLQTTVQLATQCPTSVTLVGESGIYNAQDVYQLAEAGVHAVLVGESLILAEDRPAQIAALSGVQR